MQQENGNPNGPKTEESKEIQRLKAGLERARAAFLILDGACYTVTAFAAVAGLENTPSWFQGLHNAVADSRNNAEQVNPWTTYSWRDQVQPAHVFNDDVECAEVDDSSINLQMLDLKLQQAREMVEHLQSACAIVLEVKNRGGGTYTPLWFQRICEGMIEEITKAEKHNPWNVADDDIPTGFFCRCCGADLIVPGAPSYCQMCYASTRKS